MATTLQWLDLSYGRNGEMSKDRLMTFGTFTCSPSGRAIASQILLPVICSANSQSVPIFEEFPSPSG